MGGGNYTWTLKAYGDLLEERNPGQRERMKEMGAPDDFIDVVASLGPVQGGAPPSWGVTFGVDDADAIAAKVRELGGEVLAGPFDAPWVRLAVIRDPQGATFTASQLSKHEDMGRTGRRRGQGVISARSAASVSRSTTASSGRPRPL